MIRFPRASTNLARIIAGGGVFSLTLIVLCMIYLNPELAENDLFAMLAQAIIIQGLIGLVMAFLFTGKNGTDTASGKPNDPLHVTDDTENQP